MAAGNKSMTSGLNNPVGYPLVSAGIEHPERSIILTCAKRAEKCPTQ
jgi:hypothetical protein